MKVKEIIAYIFGVIVIIIDAFGGRDFSNMNNMYEGVVMIIFFISIYLMFFIHE